MKKFVTALQCRFVIGMYADRLTALAFLSIISILAFLPLLGSLTLLPAVSMLAVWCSNLPEMLIVTIVYFQEEKN